MHECMRDRLNEGGNFSESQVRLNWRTYHSKLTDDIPNMIEVARFASH